VGRASLRSPGRRRFASLARAGRAFARQGKIGTGQRRPDSPTSGSLELQVIVEPVSGEPETLD
jgi:hypothetical protein